jgi:hypothetical protein
MMQLVMHEIVLEWENLTATGQQKSCLGSMEWAAEGQGR